MEIKEYRKFLKDTIRQEIDFSTSQQNRGFPMPPLQKPTQQGQKLIQLPPPKKDILKNNDLYDVLVSRVSHRRYKRNSLTLEELSWLLMACQGAINPDSPPVRRVVPSSGNRHPFETYLAIRKVGDLKQGIYRYLPLNHAIVLERESQKLEDELMLATLGQKFVGKAPVCFLWTAIPERMEWRFKEASVKVIAVEAGHVCQNLYLAAGSINCGACAVGSYHQGLADLFVGADGQDEFVVYIAPVGKVRT